MFRVLLSHQHTLRHSFNNSALLCCCFKQCFVKPSPVWLLFCTEIQRALQMGTETKRARAAARIIWPINKIRIKRALYLSAWGSLTEWLIGMFVRVKLSCTFMSLVMRAAVSPSAASRLSPPVQLHIPTCQSPAALPETATVKLREHEHPESNSSLTALP